ncbi:B12-binding domain-containing radical SAM protein [Paramagnetospirillum marisnigri]|uniref:B12-binding domain-containing radical SAM protein n=1 Tax=Paramagnetospirillum marisnigri TaxID=1285242 RepID=UPI000A968A16|nr:radical SAM protein [Paramagnetospirillum marisnigri]
MAKILFISDNLLNEGLGIMSLSSYVKAKGHAVDLTMLTDHPTTESVLAHIRASKPDLVGFSVMTPQVEAFRPLTAVIKEKLGLPIIWGGAHCMFMTEQVATYPGIDYICIGEGEEALLDVMDRLGSGRDCLDVAGLWSRREDGAWQKNPVGNLEPLDQYPPPDRELYYDRYPLLAGMGVKRFMTQRGCPYKCSYCFEPAMADMYDGKGKLVRRRSVDLVLEEIKATVTKYPTRQVHFSDDTFNLNKKWVHEFCSRYKQAIGLPFSCNISVQIIDEPLVAALKAAGCRGVVFGLETGVEETRMKTLSKPIPNATYLETCRLLRKYGIHYVSNIMFALPNETLEHAIESIKFNRELKPLGTKTCILKMYKGTKLADEALAKNWCEAEGEFTYKSRDVDGSHPHLENILWAGYLLVVIPGLIHFAKPILTSRWSRYFRWLILVQHIQDLILFNITPIQALVFFWKSRKTFLHGIAGRQDDDYQEQGRADDKKAA